MMDATVIIAFSFLFDAFFPFAVSLYCIWYFTAIVIYFLVFVTIFIFVHCMCVFVCVYFRFELNAI